MSIAYSVCMSPEVFMLLGVLLSALYDDMPFLILYATGDIPYVFKNPGIIWNTIRNLLMCRLIVLWLRLPLALRCDKLLNIRLLIFRLLIVVSSFFVRLLFLISYFIFVVFLVRFMFLYLWTFRLVISALWLVIAWTTIEVNKSREQVTLANNFFILNFF